MKILNRIEKLFFYLLIFTIPFQTRLILHKWTVPFNQWTSAYLYGTDLLIVFLLMLWLIRSLKNKNQIKLNFKLSDKFLLGFFLVSAISIYYAGVKSLAVYQIIKLAEFIGFYFYFKSNLGKIFEFKNFLFTIAVSGLFQGLIGIIQYIKQAKIGLGLRLLGESPLSTHTPGVAVFLVNGVKYLRSYGTTPHPNILAAWLLLSIFTFYILYFHRNGRTKLYLIFYSVLLFAFFFTFSRVILGIWGLGLIVQLLSLRRSTFAVVGISALVAMFFSIIFWPQVNSRIHISSQDEAYSERVYYNKIAGSVATHNPFFGIGTGQFVSNFMSKYKRLPQVAYQPVHNVYLLIASETGFVGLASFLLFLFSLLWQFYKKADFKKLTNFYFLLLASSFILSAFFDHFIWTSQQGSLIFWITLGLISSHEKTIL